MPTDEMTENLNYWRDKLKKAKKQRDDAQKELLKFAELVRDYSNDPGLVQVAKRKIDELT